MAPRIILGLMTFAPDPNAGGRLLSVSDLTTAFEQFSARGYTELDTARSYGGGAQEGFTRQAGWKERGFSIATKVYPLYAGAHRAEDITAAFETSLQELDVDCVDIFYIHAPDRTTPFTTTLAALNTLHTQGKFRRLGLSNFSAFEVAEIVTTCHANNWVRPTVYQGVYNVIQRGVEAELIPACRRYGIDFIAYSPIAGGLLSGNLTSPDEVPEEGRFSDKFLGGFMRGHYFRDSVFAAVAELKGVAERKGVSMIEIALRWLVHHSKIDVNKGDGIVLGVSKLEHLGSNLDALEKGPLDVGVLEALEKVYKIAKVDQKPFWYGELVYGYHTSKELFGNGN
ncbi:NADP-dependent oxidoreductase domain-containing protein [Cercophora newfieldiana]|uniref:NADP-dependent oxidoreductase domain-containing protein n=1 Tax=Cercophora newfieldiana TaxID=92897 RepID=A0AA40CQV7_9PEZI|nr:NADP-dependent oxidoreductase domain-containing protein [Cercophora newfieldiana]